MRKTAMFMTGLLLMVSSVVVAQQEKTAAAGNAQVDVPLQNWAIPFDRYLANATGQKATNGGRLQIGTNALPSNNSTFIAIPPCRLYDSRSSGPAQPLTGGTSRTIDVVAGPCGLPSNAAAYSFNVTTFGSTSTGSYAFVTIYPTGSARPTISTMNFLTGSQTSNAAMVPAGTSGAVDIYSTVTTNFVFDVNGYMTEGVGPLATSANTANTLVLRDGTGGFSAGTINATKVLNAVYQDVAEWVPSDTMTPGEVVVLDPNDGRRVTASSRAYDTSVAGVVSENPGIVLGREDATKAQIATTGRVMVFVDATKAPIHVGDLLVTSDVAGTAMKSMPLSLDGTPVHRPGTIIGKALQPLASGKGRILVLLSLQ